MHVVATAGHVDHGKSTLVRALTGMEPDRWAEERRRGMTIDLGFAWTTLPSGGTVAFVDVPGHERFVANMLAGVGPVPAAMIVVAADEGWMPQSAEHLAALDALGVRHGLLVVTRSDLADPAAALAQARERIAPTGLGAVAAVAVSAVTGAGLDDLRVALDRLVAAVPSPEPGGPVRFFLDRVFTVKGAGTVVTGTLGGGTIAVGDELALGGSLVRVRGLQALGAAETSVTAVARVAVNLRGVPTEKLSRGDALLTPGSFRPTDLVDVRLAGDPVKDLPQSVTVHIGSAAVPARVRPLGPDTCRLRLSHPLPLRIGDRALLRDPGRHHIAGGATVLDVRPPGLTRRGAAAARAADLATMTGTPSLAGELRRRLLIRAPDLTAMGVPAPDPQDAGPQDAGAVRGPVTGDWYADPAHWAALAERLGAEVTAYREAHPLEPGAPVEALRHRLGLPARALVEALVEPPLRISDGRIGDGRVGTGPAGLPAELVAAVDKAFAGRPPFAAPEAYQLIELGLGVRQQAAGVRAGLLVQLAPKVVLRATAVPEAAERLRRLGRPFTISEARKELDTTRRVAVPLLELLDRRGVTSRLPDDRREFA
ncbi:selenocysteine-specific translation elongation factor [Paractinoplanes ferrugineus]|uniref:Selenocysteine-specific translation elongation factor n=1 Tax=Paractinoplanes ferrugineus TaxID=113564 RepID=A0A919IYU2_9ACTN|nr:selenocysteine-specific translation elongation factor [Actinoplanes ferrugineus]GIE11335.1 selenocysteine-specific translation elongation factor [Actinoplanes ferrugineus]